MAIDDGDFFETMAEVAKALTASADPDDILQAITRTALKVVPGTDFASISVTQHGGRIITVAPTNDILLVADQLQYDTGEGPCLAALEQQETMRSDDLEVDPRWPVFGPKAVELGLRSQMAVELFSTGSSRAALNMYSTTRGTYDESNHIAELFSTHAVVAMGFAHEAQSLHEAIGTRQVIGAAVGIVMQRYTLDEDRAFSFLVRLSQTSNTKLRDVADRIISAANEVAEVAEDADRGDAEVALSD